MSANELLANVTELQELKRMQEEIQAEIDAIADRVKAYMTANGLETLTAGVWKVSYQDVTSARIDTAKLRNDLPEVWQEYGKTTTCKRFTVK